MGGLGSARWAPTRLNGCVERMGHDPGAVLAPRAFSAKSSGRSNPQAAVQDCVGWCSRASHCCRSFDRSACDSWLIEHWSREVQQRHHRNRHGNSLYVAAVLTKLAVCCAKSSVGVISCAGHFFTVHGLTALSGRRLGQVNHGRLARWHLHAHRRRQCRTGIGGNGHLREKQHANKCKANRT